MNKVPKRFKYRRKIKLNQIQRRNKKLLKRMKLFS
jgi:hypothetical protein